jgi:hypothetical protein
MPEYLSNQLRKRVAARAAFICEYCLVHEDDMYSGYQIDHVISLKHGGTSDFGNLAYACALCNVYKGTDVGSIVFPSGQFTRLYNPRSDRWLDHFAVEGSSIVPLTAIGQATIDVLQLNHSRRLPIRELLIQQKRYPNLIPTN